MTIAAVCLLVGLTAGSLLTRALSPQERKRRELEEKLREKDDELKIYQRDVADHLIKTSGLIRELNRNQREISEQLATSAMLLASPEVSREVQDAAFSGLSADSKLRILSSVPPEPPKDYAPSVPGGVLSENYGFDELPDRGTYTKGIADIRTAARDAASESEDDDPTYKVS
jgi:uncharacterized membrane-anchored protein YhcB (DUF1043 family)